MSKVATTENTILPISYGSPIFSMREIEFYTRHLLGKFLTVIDTIVPEGQQSKSTKDIVKSLVWDGSFSQLEKYWSSIDKNNTPRRPFPFVGSTGELETGV
mgnify:CR=1 FL=1